MGGYVEATILEELVSMALQRAFFAQPPIPSLLVHSDRDRTRWAGQYYGNAYRQLLHDYAAVRSQSRRDECYGDTLPSTTQAKSLWSRLKTEVLELREWPVFTDLVDAKASIADYFDYYNHDRLHASIGYQTSY